MEILLYTIVFLLLLVVSNVTNRLLPPASSTSSANCAGDFAWFFPSSGEISFRYRVIFGLGNRAFALSGG